MLDTDAEQYGGHKRLDHSVDYFTANDPWDNRRCSMMVGDSPQPISLSNSHIHVHEVDWIVVIKVCLKFSLFYK